MDEAAEPLELIEIECVTPASWPAGPQEGDRATTAAGDVARVSLAAWKNGSPFIVVFGDLSDAKRNWRLRSTL